MEGAVFRSQMGRLSGMLLWLSANTESLPRLFPLRIIRNVHPLLYAETLENAQGRTGAQAAHMKKKRAYKAL